MSHAGKRALELSKATTIHLDGEEARRERAYSKHICSDPGISLLHSWGEICANKQLLNGSTEQSG